MRWGTSSPARPVAVGSLQRAAFEPYWLIQTEELARRNGCLESYPDWLAASYRLQATCLKTNLEAARRSRLAGTSVWLFQDYPNCAEGVVNMFGEAKGNVRGAISQVQRADGPAPRHAGADPGGAARPPRCVLSSRDSRTLRRRTATLRWSLKNRNGHDRPQERRRASPSAPAAIQELPAVALELPEGRAAAAKLTLEREALRRQWHGRERLELVGLPAPTRSAIPTAELAGGWLRPDPRPLSGAVDYQDGPVPSDDAAFRDDAVEARASAII